MQPAGLVERPLGDPEHAGECQDDVPCHDRAVRQWRGPDGDLVDRRLPADAARRRRDEMALGHGRVVERARQPDEDRVVGLAQGRRVATLRPDDLRALDQPLGAKEADRQFRLVPGRPHRHGDRDRLLSRAGGPDLEGCLADDPVLDQLQAAIADRHDGARHDMTHRRRRTFGALAWPRHPQRSRKTAGAIGRRQWVELIAPR